MIYNSAGQVVEQGQRRDDFNGGLNLKPGLYLVRVRTTDGQQTTVKVLKQ
ncbi:T9SS type A sorting domain-containing protein [Hymenobacter volaticus]|uniref:T9SS type A sorting domain-containing protein n=2 Tax=Hymenobacter volaticus TaxID=2932254 RepID=A0ABY4GDD2_9BACT|nr:T9SS type A sorting domain-containing protein [Hymenobacter volaticus]